MPTKENFKNEVNEEIIVPEEEIVEVEESEDTAEGNQVEKGIVVFQKQDGTLAYQFIGENVTLENLTYYTRFLKTIEEAFWNEQKQKGGTKMTLKFKDKNGNIVMKEDVNGNITFFSEDMKWDMTSGELEVVPDEEEESSESRETSKGV